MSTLRRKVVAVTGASGGIGRASAIAFGGRGAAVALLARGAQGLESAAEEVRAAGGEALVVPTDVSDPDQVNAAVDRIEKELGPVEVWVNVAFTSVFSRFDDISPDEYRRVTEVSYLGYVYSTMAVLPRMKQRGQGVIVQVGSALAYRGIPLQTAYCGSKHAIQGFHEALRCELLHDKSPVRVTMVQMPAVNTPQFSWVMSRLRHRAQPVPPIYQPEVAANAVVYAAEHPRRREYWVGGSTVGTLVANAVCPGVLDRYLARTGFSAQQTGESQPSDAPENLWEPADARRDFGTHGRFDDRANPHSRQLWASQHHGLLGAGAAVLGGALLAGSRAWRR
ncbi:SDR family oxidoreductase [Pedococcus bigeumensis]|uniref:SDR family oxidoreductase n=1 Tax=Pedococcus bigeumensis TaxID=433644 RepID=UPI002FEA3387